MGEARATPCNGAAGPAAHLPGAAKVGADGTTYGYAPGEGLDDRTVEPTDPAGTYLPLVQQTGDGTLQNVNTTVLGQPLDFTHLAEKYAQHVTDFISENKDDPFLLYMPFSHVHTTAANQPFKQYAGCQFQNSSQRGPFGDALAEADWITGQIVAALESAGIDKNTLIVFTGDNGPWLAQGLSGGSRGLLTGEYSGYDNTGKGSTWEGGIREAGFAYWPGVIQPMSRSSEIVSSLDIFATAANLSGAGLPANRPYDGRNMMPVLLGGKSDHEFLFFYKQPDVPSAVRYGKWKAHFTTSPGIGGCQPSHACKSVTYYPPKDPKKNATLPLLFNVDADPSEEYPINPKGSQPADGTPEAEALKAIVAAYESEVASFVARQPMQSTTCGPSGQYGVCCDRSKNCDCDGPPSARA